MTHHDPLDILLLVEGSRGFSPAFKSARWGGKTVCLVEVDESRSDVPSDSHSMEMESPFAHRGFRSHWNVSQSVTLYFGCWVVGVTHQ